MSESNIVALQSQIAKLFLRLIGNAVTDESWKKARQYEDVREDESEKARRLNDDESTSEDERDTSYASHICVSCGEGILDNGLCVFEIRDSEFIPKFMCEYDYFCDHRCLANHVTRAAQSK